MSERSKQLAAIFAVILAVGVASFFGAKWQAEAAAEEQITTLYNYQVLACQQANPQRYAVALAIGTAADTSKDAAAAREYARAEHRILVQPHIRPDGTKECIEAVPKP